MASSSHPIDCRVLHIRHFPSNFTQAQCSDLVEKCGACKVTFRKKNAFGFFYTENDAKNALTRLHQLQLNNKVLLVTYARADDFNIPLLPPPPLANSPEIEKSSIIHRIHGISPQTEYIFNPMVKYKYPPINDNILANICTALRGNPNLYTQLLHLMNKLNIQPPFRRQTIPRTVFQRATSVDAVTQMTSESESDLSDEEPKKRKRKRVPESTALNFGRIRRQITKISLESLLPTVDPTNVEECFESTRRISKLVVQPPQCLLDKTKSNSQDAEMLDGFGLIEPRPASPVVQIPETRFDWNISFTHSESLKKLPVVDTIDHPAFRNYDEGDLSNRLYLKNLHKSTTEEDLFEVFGQFVPSSEAEQSIFDIRLMKSGRMRGQAFITYGSTQTAQKALEACHRVIIKGNPIAVQFAKFPVSRGHENQQT